ncbi:MAG: hypothetical protein R3Y64_10290 [Peptostreptococcaceae bacterium]
MWTYLVPLKIDAYDNEGDKIEYIELLAKYQILINNEIFEQVECIFLGLEILSYMPKKHSFI